MAATRSGISKPDLPRPLREQLFQRLSPKEIGRQVAVHSNTSNLVDLSPHFESFQSEFVLLTATLLVVEVEVNWSGMEWYRTSWSDLCAKQSSGMPDRNVFIPHKRYYKLHHLESNGQTVGILGSLKDLYQLPCSPNPANLAPALTVFPQSNKQKGQFEGPRVVHPA